MAVIGYARVSTTDQDLDSQIQALKDAGAVEIYADKASGATTARTQWLECAKNLQSGDVLLVSRIDRLGRSLQDLLNIIEKLKENNIHFRSLNEPSLDTTTPAGKMLFQIVGAFAEYERSLIRARTIEGLENAKRKGKKVGRPTSLSDEQVEALQKMYLHGESITALARIFEVSRKTVYRVLNFSN